MANPSVDARLALNLRPGAPAHEVLVLGQKESVRDVKTKYRRLSKQWHPDKTANTVGKHVFQLVLLVAFSANRDIIPPRLARTKRDNTEPFTN